MKAVRIIKKFDDDLILALVNTILATHNAVRTVARMQEAADTATHTVQLLLCDYIVFDKNAKPEGQDGH